MFRCIARDVMTEEGVNGLSLTAVARRLGVQPPSIYKYFPSLMAVYDALFLRGQIENLAVMRAAMADAVAAGQLGPEADSDEAVYLPSTLICGVVSQAMANEPDLAWGEGRFTPAFPRLMALFDGARWESDVDPDPMITTSLRLPKSLLDWVRQQASTQRTKPTALIRAWIEERRDHELIPRPARAGDDLVERLERLERAVFDQPG